MPRALTPTNDYRQIRPIEAFRSLVDVYWINRPGDGAGVCVLPDGCIDLIFQGGATGGRLFSSALIDAPVLFRSGQRDWFVGVRFRPAMARVVLDIDPIECRNRDIPAAEIDPTFGALERELQECASPHAALTLLKRAVDARLAKEERQLAPPHVQEALNLLGRGGDVAHVHRVARALGMTERSLHRALLRWSGLAPKPMARILRMQRTIAAIRAGRVPLALIAQRMGYADQAHMTRELRALTGLAPSAFAVRNLQDTDARPAYVS
jgi:AraC-like DNA-binding protein